MPSDAPSVFISYSHVDETWKDRLVKQLRVLALENVLERSCGGRVCWPRTTAPASTRIRWCGWQG